MTQLNVSFGHWHYYLSYLDYHYHNIVTKLINFAKEAGVDRYGRYYNFEELVDFAMDAQITDKTADYIYRHYTYHIISKHEPINVDEEEYKYLAGDFTII